MQVSWSYTAAFDMADRSLWEKVKAQSETMFAEAPAPDGVLLASGARMVELPCGVEIEFVEPSEDRVVVLRASWLPPLESGY